MLWHRHSFLVFSFVFEKSNHLSPPSPSPYSPHSFKCRVGKLAGAQTPFLEKKFLWVCPILWANVNWARDVVSTEVSFAFIHLHYKCSFAFVQFWRRCLAGLWRRLARFMTTSRFRLISCCFVVFWYCEFSVRSKFVFCDLCSYSMLYALSVPFLCFSTRFSFPFSRLLSPVPSPCPLSLISALSSSSALSSLSRPLSPVNCLPSPYSRFVSCLSPVPSPMSPFPRPLSSVSSFPSPFSRKIFPVLSSPSPLSSPPSPVQSLASPFSRPHSGAPSSPSPLPVPSHPSPLTCPLFRPLSSVPSLPSSLFRPISLVPSHPCPFRRPSPLSPFSRFLATCPLQGLPRLSPSSPLSRLLSPIFFLLSPFLPHFNVFVLHASLSVVLLSFVLRSFCVRFESFCDYRVFSLLFLCSFPMSFRRVSRPPWHMVRPLPNFFLFLFLKVWFVRLHQSIFQVRFDCVLFLRCFAWAPREYGEQLLSWFYFFEQWFFSLWSLWDRKVALLTFLFRSCSWIRRFLIRRWHWFCVVICLFFFFFVIHL